LNLGLNFPPPKEAGLFVILADFWVNWGQTGDNVKKRLSPFFCAINRASTPFFKAKKNWGQWGQ